LINGLDLNLLAALHALLEERHVTRAGHRLGLSQPAMSANLARLRRHFDDELLVRAHGGYELTPLAATLVEPTATAWRAVGQVFAGPSGFDPAESDREFTLVLSDYAITIFGAELTRVARAQAPDVRFRFAQITDHVLADVDGTLRRTDGLVIPHGIVHGHPAVDLYQDRWVLIAAKGSPATRAPLTVELLGRLPWAVAPGEPTAGTAAAHLLSLLGRFHPRVEVVVDHFQALPFLVAGTDRVALIQERLAWGLRGAAGLEVLDCPYEPPPIIQALWFHPMYEDDPGHCWLRRTMTAIGRRLNT
jgi:DNA-binding transcriptional LysR family regulator